MSATVEIREEDGEYAATDSETGATGVGPTRAMALAALAVRLGARDGEEGDGAAQLEALANRTRERFDEQGVTEADVEDAIAWARSE